MQNTARPTPYAQALVSMSKDDRATPAATSPVDLENQTNKQSIDTLSEIKAANKQAIETLSDLKSVLLSISTTSAANKKRNHDTMANTGDQTMLNSSIEFSGYSPPTKKPSPVTRSPQANDEAPPKQHQRPVPNNVLPPVIGQLPKPVFSQNNQTLFAQQQVPQKYRHPTSTIAFSNVPQRIQTQQPPQAQQHSPPVHHPQQVSAPQHAIVTPERHAYPSEEMRARIVALANNVHGSIQPMGPYLTEAQHIAILRHLEYASAIMYQRNAPP
jgi:hypothetical protein